MSLTGTAVDYLVVFWAGVLTSFTPCIYPALPLAASFISGANTKGTRSSAFGISLVYVLGLALTYSILGVLAALLGKAFGQIQHQPIVYLMVGAVLLFFALVMSEKIPLIFLGVNRPSQWKPKNLWMVFVFGLMSGFVVGPCVTPILGAILLKVSLKQNIFYGVSLLFVFSYGVGASLILAGTFSGFLSRLPKSGKWSGAIKQFCATILFLAAVYFLAKGFFLAYGISI